MNLPQPPDYLPDMYRQPDYWEPYDSSKGYRKKPCAIKLRNGGGLDACWPNAGKFVSLEDSSIHIPCEDVVEIAYYVGLDEDSEISLCANSEAANECPLEGKLE